MLKMDFLILLILFSFIGCGGGKSHLENDTGTTNPPPASPELPPSDDNPAYSNLFSENSLWAKNVWYKSSTFADKVKVEHVAYSDAGGLCYIIYDASLSDSQFPLVWNNTLECWDRNGEAIFTLKNNKDKIFKDVLFLNDGSIVVAELVSIEDGDANLSLYYLQLSHYSSQGGLMQRKILSDIPDEQELLYYHISFEDIVEVKPFPELTNNGKPALFDSALVKLKVMNNRLYLLAYTYGIKVYSLMDTLESRWDAQVMPAHTWLWAGILQNKADFTVTDSDQVVVAFDGYKVEANVYEQHFQRPLGKQGEKADIFVATVNDVGEHQNIFLAGRPEYSEHLVGVETDGIDLIVAANVRHNKVDPDSNINTEWDILLNTVRIMDGESLSYKMIDFDNEDFASDFKRTGDGAFIVSGKTGFDQADTNSQTSYGSAMVLKVDEQGNIFNSIVLSFPRDVSILSAIQTKDDQVLFSGTYDAPITHTCDNDMTLCYQKGMVGVIKFN